MCKTDFTFKSTAIYQNVTVTLEIAMEKIMNKIKDFFLIIKRNLPRSCYVYN